MIRYQCEQCMEWNEVENAMAGKPAECHKCHYIKVVPLPEYLPRLTCPYCEDHEWNALTEEQGGTMIKCPKCQHMVRIPGESKGCSFTAAILFLAGLTLGLLASGVLW